MLVIEKQEMETTDYVSVIEPRAPLIHVGTAS